MTDKDHEEAAYDGRENPLIALSTGSGTDMCGIAGYHWFNADIDIDAMVAALRHRGPDDQGCYTNGRVGLGSRRLSIVDPAGGDQPVHNEEETVWTVFNGEIYNHEELRKELQDAGHRFYTGTDTEVIVHAYEEWGTDCVDRFEGMYAFAVWDETAERLVLARDPIGKKPLYYYQDDEGRLLFGSEIKALLAAEVYTPQLDIAAARQFLAYGYTRSPDTLFAGVQKLRPGEILTLTGKSKKSRIQNIKSPAASMDAKEAADRLRPLLKENVRLWSREGGSYGVFLSGGVDSSAVLALLSRNDDLDVAAYTASFPGNKFDETAHAERVASHFGVDHHVVELPETAIEVVPDIITAFDDLMADQANVPYYLLSQEASQHGRVAFTGSGGDEMFCGYEHYRIMDIGDRYVTALPRPVRGVAPALARYTPDTVLEKFFPYARELGPAGIKRFAQYLDVIESTDAAYEAINAMMTGAEVDQLLDEDVEVSRPVTPSFDTVTAESELKRVMRYEQQEQLPEKNLMKADKNGMAHGLELRTPLLTRSTLRFSAGLPPSLLRGRGGKQVFKRAVQPFLPDDILNRRKQRLLAPIHHWLGEDGAWTWEEVEDRYGQPDMLNAEAMEQMVAGLSSSPLYYARQLWNVIHFTIWYDRYL